MLRLGPQGGPGRERASQDGGGTHPNSRSLGLNGASYRQASRRCQGSWKGFSALEKRPLRARVGRIGGGACGVGEGEELEDGEGSRDGRLRSAGPTRARRPGQPVRARSRRFLKAGRFQLAAQARREDASDGRPGAARPSDRTIGSPTTTTPPARTQDPPLTRADGPDPPPLDRCACTPSPPVSLPRADPQPGALPDARFAIPALLDDQPSDPLLAAAASGGRFGPDYYRGLDLGRLGRAEVRERGDGGGLEEGQRAERDGDEVEQPREDDDDDDEQTELDQVGWLEAWLEAQHQPPAVRLRAAPRRPSLAY